ncbi:MAG TPA: hypothetical protein VFC93_19350 [Chloroflexota bacterium]|nr:hypothetical protein [Chloroflexota bacterium]
MANHRSVMISELEAWAIEDMIRHTWMDEGRPVGKGLLLKVFTLVHEFEARRNDESPPAELPLVLTEDELWAIDFHIRRGHLDPSGVRVGKELLLKVFDRLLDIRNAEEMKRLRFAHADEHENPEHERRLRELREHYRRLDDAGRSEPGDT